MVRRVTSVTALFVATSVTIGLCASLAAARPSSGPINILSVKPTVVTNSSFGLMRQPAALKRTELNTVVASTALTFKVAIHNGGASTKRNTAVKLVISPQRSNRTTEKTVTVTSLRSGQSATVKFDHLGAVAFGIKTSLTISVDGHDKTYPILFSLPG